jgi:hypothetical protein
MSRGKRTPARVAPVNPKAEYLKKSLRFRSFGFMVGLKPPFLGWIFFPAEGIASEPAHRQTTISPAADRCQELKSHIVEHARGPVVLDIIFYHDLDSL